MTQYLTGTGVQTTNSATLSGAPIFSIGGTGLTLVNDGSLTSDTASIAAIEITGTGATIVNNVGGTIRSSTADQRSVAIQGSAGDDILNNDGTIYGVVDMGDGNDAIAYGPTSQTYDAISGYAVVRLGAGDDRLSVVGVDAPPNARGGSGFDTLSLQGTRVFHGSGVFEFERLEIGSNVQNVDSFAGFQQIDISAARFINFLDSNNPLVTLQMAEVAVAPSVTIGLRSTFAGVIGTSRKDYVTVSNGATVGDVLLGAGDDVFSYDRWGFNRSPSNLHGIVDGGDGIDTLQVEVDDGSSLDLANFRGFEQIATGLQVNFTGKVTLVHADDMRFIQGDIGGQLVLNQSNSPEAVVGLPAGMALTLGTGTTIARIGGASDAPVTGISYSASDLTVGPAVTITNAGIVLGDVNLTAGDDVVDGGLGTVNGTVYGYAGNDRLVGGTGQDRLDGGSGDDLLEGGNGNDSIWGGAGADTMNGGNGNDTLYPDGDISVDGGAGDDLFIFQAATVVGGSLIGGSGTDTLDFRGATFDSTSGSATFTGFEKITASSSLTGTAGNDVLDLSSITSLDPTFGDPIYLTIHGGNGNDIITGGAENDQLYGDLGADILNGGAGNDAIFSNADISIDGGDGNDYVFFRAGTLLRGSFAGGAGTDYLVFDGATFDANTGSISFAGFEGVVDYNGLVGTAGNDVLDLRSITGLAGLNFLNIRAGAGADTIFGGDEWDRIIAEDGNDILDGGNGNDIIYGGAGYDIIKGGAGNDYLFGDWDTSIDGGDGDDIISFANSAMINGAYIGGAGIDTLELDGGIFGANSATATFTGFEKITDASVLRGGTGNDVLDLSTLNALDGTYSLTINAGDGNDSITGGMERDTINGDAGNDRLDGGLGADTLSGGTGDDIYIVDEAGDVVTEAAGEGEDTVYAGLSYILGANVERLVLTGTGALWGIGNASANIITGNAGANRLIGYDGNDQLYGGAGDDVLDGGTGSDVLDGGTGADSMWGGTGDDFYVVDDAGDAVVEAAGEGIDTVYASISYQLGANAERLALTGNAALWGIGNAADNIVSGNDGANRLIGNDGNDTLNGGAGQDVLDGGAGRDLLDGGTGADSLWGGAGDDAYVIDDAGDAVVEAVGEGFDTVYAGVSYMLAANVEQLALTGSAALWGLGNAGDNVISGNDGANRLIGYDGNDQLFGGAGQDVLDGGIGNDRLDGGLGADSLWGGAGNDSYIVDDAGDVVVESAGEGTDIIYASVSYSIAANVEQLVLTGGAALGGIGGAGDDSITGNDGANRLIGNAGNDQLFGGAGDDVLDGGAGNDRLDGGAGADTMYGGAGDDIYIIDQAYETVSEAAGEGDDIVYSSVNHMLMANVERLVLLGTEGIAGGGNEGDNVITGNSGNNTLSGNGGNDFLFGNAGNDYLDGGWGTNVIDGGDGTDRLVLWGAIGDYTSSAGSNGQWIVNGGNATNILSNVELIECRSATAFGVYSLADFVAATGGNSAPMASFAAFAPDDHLFVADQVEYGAGLI
jgi:Ca2+-binding RTX toxin-like protein